jgi:hypothetical protein
MYTSIDLFLAELLSVLTAFVMNQLLANKNKNGWLFYVLSSVTLIYVLIFKDSWMSVTNQTMMVVLGIKNFVLFHTPEHKWHRQFDRLAIVVFFGSLFFLRGFDGKSLSELVLWMAILGKTIFLGKNNIKGWHFQILQQLLSIIFGWYRGIYIYIIKSIIFTFQGIYGLWKWRKMEE